MAIHALIPYFAGLAAGTTGAWFLSMRLHDQLFRTQVHDPNGFVVPIVFLLAIGIIVAVWSTRQVAAIATSDLLRA
jgi:hypothetical protein